MKDLNGDYDSDLDKQIRIDEFSQSVFNKKLDIKLYDFLIIHRYGYSIIREKISNLNLDQDLTSGLISAIITVSKELFDEGKGIKILDFGNNKIVVESGKFIIIGIITEFVTNDLKKYLRDLVNYIENEFSLILEEFSGELDSIEPVTITISGALSPYIIKPFIFPGLPFDKIPDLELKLFSINDLNLISIEYIAEMKNRIKGGKKDLNESQIYSLCRLLSHDALTFSEIEDLLNIDKYSLTQLLSNLYSKGFLRIFQRLAERERGSLSTPIRVASRDNYLLNINNMKTVGDITVLETSLTFNKILEDNAAIIFPVLLAVVKTEDKIIPYVMKNIDKFRGSIAKEVLREAMSDLNSKDMNILRTLKKIDSFW
jgi:hypothetical protein